jgi:hypothetical protein
MSTIAVKREFAVQSHRWKGGRFGTPEAVIFVANFTGPQILLTNPAFETKDLSLMMSG